MILGWLIGWLWAKIPRRKIKVDREQIPAMVGVAATTVSLRGKVYFGYWEEIDCGNDIMKELMDQYGEDYHFDKGDLMIANKLCKKAVEFVKHGKILV